MQACFLQPFLGSNMKEIFSAIWIWHFDVNQMLNSNQDGDLNISFYFVLSGVENVVKDERIAVENKYQVPIFLDRYSGIHSSLKTKDF